MSMNWEGYMASKRELVSTYQSLAKEIGFSKPSFKDIDRLQVYRDYRETKPGVESLARAIGGLAAYVPDNVLRNCLESAAYPRRTDFDSSLRDAYNQEYAPLLKEKPEEPKKYVPYEVDSTGNWYDRKEK